MAPEHFHSPHKKRLDTPVSARHFRAKLKITFALLIPQIERNHAIGLSPRASAPKWNAAVEGEMPELNFCKATGPVT